ncbi:unnamed protein product [Arabis nemorensis]|uniref:No apical meristem-associated C-terminal domain-containing protein n=1 Tax=Arabis nemorensis TaxID=586526 RepID=A0A565AUQ0_9BRAS|nr:unnamed protein product [Arabis nemorensis]
MTTILAAVSKLRGCVNHIENKNPSNASEQDILNQAKTLLEQDIKYNKGFKFDHVWPILKDTEKFSNNHTSRAAAFPEEGRNVMSSSSFQDESSPSSDMNSFDLNMNSEEATVNISQRPMGMKKAKRKQQSDEPFKQMMEQNDRLIKAIAKGTSEKNEIQRQKVEVQRMKQENKILFADLNSITDPASREYIKNQRAIILRRRAPTNQYEEHGEGSQSQYHGSQYRASRYQGEQAEREQVGAEHVQGQQPQGQQSQGENQRSPSDQQDYTQYYHYFSGTENNYPGY